MKGNRPSSLPVARFCARSPALNLGAGRAAALSSVWHARAAGKDWQDAYNRLTEEEREDIDSWQLPRTFTAAIRVGKVVASRDLSYSDAVKEMECGLNEYCGWSTKESPDCLTAGTCDFHWIVGRRLFVADLKKSVYTEPDGPNSLQVKCYALALAAYYGDKVDGYYTGIWAAEEGVWMWGEYTALDSEQCAQDWAEVKAAALNIDGDYNVGPHCRKCYARTRCPAYLIPPEQAEGLLAKYFTGELDTARAYELLSFLERIDKLSETGWKIVEAHEELFGGIPDGNGRVWRSVDVKGKMRLDRAALERDHPELVRKYFVQGKGHKQRRWTKERSK